MLDRADAHLHGILPEDLSLHAAKDDILFAVIGELSRLVEEKKTMLLNTMDVTTETGVRQTLARQGEVLGIELVLNFLIGKCNGP